MKKYEIGPLESTLKICTEISVRVDEININITVSASTNGDKVIGKLNFDWCEYGEDEINEDIGRLFDAITKQLHFEKQECMSFGFKEYCINFEEEDNGQYYFLFKPKMVFSLVQAAVKLLNFSDGLEKREVLDDDN